MSKSRTLLTGAFAAAFVLSLALGGPAAARRGGSFGSRGSRTYAAPRPTPSAPGVTPPVQRSMTAPQPGANPYGYRPAAPGYPAPGALGAPRMGFGAGLLSGVLTGGLIGGLMGHGWGMGWGGPGGGWGLGGSVLTIILQLLAAGLMVSLLLRLFRGPQALAGGPGLSAPGYGGGGAGPQAAGPWADPSPPNGGPGSAANEIAVSASDRAAFERLLIAVQDAFAREDYAGLRALCTPEVMGYLAEELSDNATHGRRNEVSGTRLIACDVSEAWSEADADFATAALRYESLDVMRDRATGQILEGDPSRPTETTELWTFVRRAGGPWMLSAIQETR